MNREILDFMRETPEVYAPNEFAFWDDEHISKNMLAAHLAPEVDAASRPLAFIKRSVDWLAAYLGGGSGKRLIDLGCGPGIYAHMLTGKDFRVTGIDFSKRSIDYAAEQARAAGEDIDYHYQNYLDIDYEGEFDAAIMVYCDFGVLSPADRSTLLRKTHRALKPGGRLILDAWNTPYGSDFHEGSSIEYSDGGFWSPEKHVTVERNIYYRGTANILDRYMIITENECRRFNIWNQIYDAASLSRELTEAGFSGVELFDDISGAGFTGKRATICAAAGK